MTTNTTNTASSSGHTDDGKSKTKAKETSSSVKLHNSNVNDSTEAIPSETNPKEAMDTSDCNSVLEADEVTEDCFRSETKEEAQNADAIDETNQPDQPNQPESKDIVNPIIDEIVTKGIDKLTVSESNINSGTNIETVPDGAGETSTNSGDATTTTSSSSQRTNIRFVRKSLENTTLSVMYSKSYYDTDTIETEYPRNFDDNIELLSRETEDLEKQFTASEDKLLHYVPTNL